VGVGLIAVSSLVLAAVAELRSKTTRRDVIFFAILVGFPVAALMLFGFAVHMRLLGRHFTSLLPFLLMLVALGLRQLLFGTHKLARAVGIGAIAILLISALEIRFAPRHRRDDYRSATSIARAAIATGKKVWWLADETAGAYYNLPLNSPNLVSTSNLLRHPVKSLPPPDLVCLSKPDIYDPDAEIRNYVREHDFTLKRMLPAFQIFDRASQHSQAH
jgi:hypothetical protein